MPDETHSAEGSPSDGKPAYEAPAIEEVVSRDGLEREVAYAGTVGPSRALN